MRSPHHNRHRETASRGPPVRAASFRFCCRYRQDPRARSRRREKFQPFYAPAIINGGSSTAQAKDLLGRMARVPILFDRVGRLGAANPAFKRGGRARKNPLQPAKCLRTGAQSPDRSEEHTSELQSLMRISYAVFCLKKKTTYPHNTSLQDISLTTRPD